VRVTAQRTSDGATFGPTQTDANGYYTIHAGYGMAQGYALAFTPQTCPLCSSGFQPAAATVTTPNGIGRIAVRDKALTATP
jgi:hypothetical protein